MTNRKKLLAAVILLLAAAGTGFILKGKSSAGQPEAKQQNKKITIASSASGFISFPYYVAQKKGFFSQNGLDVEFKQMETSVSAQALLAGDIDYSPFITGVISASQNGFPAKILLALSEKSSNFLVGQAGADLKDLKTLGVSQPFGPQHYQALELIDRDAPSAKILFLKGASGVRAQIIAKAIDAGIVSAAAAFQLEDKGFKILKSLQGENLVDGGLVTTDDKIKNEPEEIRKVIAAVRSAINFIKTDPAQTQEMLLDYYSFEKNDANKKITEKIYQVAKEYFLADGLPQESSVINSMRFAKSADTESFADINGKTISQENIAKSFNFEFLK